MKNKEIILIILLLLSAIIISYATPRVKYKSPEIASKLDVPWRMDGWTSKSVSGQFNLTDQRFNFVSDVFARVYLNRYGESLLFFILDAGNFHNPKVCFGGSGYKIKEQPKIEFKTGNRTIMADAVFFEKPRESYLVIYWICIDKKQVDWTRQKLIQLWYSLFNKQKVGLMIRMDIPTTENNIPNSIKLAQDFIRGISSKIPSDQADYIFGTK